MSRASGSGAAWVAYDVVLGPIEDDVLGERASEAFMNTMNSPAPS